MEDPRRDFGTFHNGEVANSAAIQYWSVLFTRNCNCSDKIEEENITFVCLLVFCEKIVSQSR